MLVSKKWKSDIQRWFFLRKKYKSTFKNMSINLLSIANIPLIANDKYDICLKYYIPNKSKIQSKIFEWAF